jgi:hypothetical protein
MDGNHPINLPASLYRVPATMPRQMTVGIPKIYNPTLTVGMMFPWKY